MQRQIIALLVFASTCVPALAADFAACDPGGTQIEMTACAVDDLDLADKKLNEVYKALMKKEAKNKPFVEKLRAAQKAWVAFRDAELAAMFACDNADPDVCWGSMTSQCYSSYQAKMTRERTKRLTQFLEQGQPADECH